MTTFATVTGKDHFSYYEHNRIKLLPVMSLIVSGLLTILPHIPLLYCFILTFAMWKSWNYELNWCWNQSISLCLEKHYDEYVFYSSIAISNFTITSIVVIYRHIELIKIKISKVINIILIFIHVFSTISYIMMFVWLPISWNLHTIAAYAAFTALQTYCVSHTILCVWLICCKKQFNHNIRDYILLLYFILNAVVFVFLSIEWTYNNHQYKPSEWIAFFTQYMYFGGYGYLFKRWFYHKNKMSIDKQSPLHGYHEKYETDLVQLL